MCTLEQHQNDIAQLTADECGAWRDVRHEIVEKMKDVCNTGNISVMIWVRIMIAILRP